MTWRDLPLLLSEEAFSAMPMALRDRCFSHPEAVFRKGPPGQWDDYGVRDPAPLTGPNGHWLKDSNNQPVLYYMASSKQGEWQGVGRAVTADGGRSWVRDPGSAVLRPGSGAWDGRIATTAWVLLCPDGVYRLYYRGNLENYTNEGIGLAESRDGRHFSKSPANPLLTSRDFTDIPDSGMGLMAVMNAIVMQDGKILLTFEGTSASHGSTTQIFGATSQDGVHFEPMNHGFPIFTHRHVRSWPTERVANPRLTWLEDEDLYVLVFNARGKPGVYALGVAVTRDFSNWQEHPRNPLVFPSRDCPDQPFSGRLEGGCLDKADLEEDPEKLWMYLMAIPFQGPSHKDAVIGRSLGVKDPIRGRFAFTATSEKSHEIQVMEGGRLVVNRLGSSFPPRVHFSSFKDGPITGVRGRIILGENSRIQFGIAPEPESNFMGRAMVCRVHHETITLHGGEEHGEMPRRGSALAFCLWKNQSQVNLTIDERSIKLPVAIEPCFNFFIRHIEGRAELADLQISRDPDPIYNSVMHGTEVQA